MTMTIQNLIAMCQAQLANLSMLRTSAERLGDIDQVMALDAKLAETQNTLNELQSLG
jgi:chaperonin cofactor prefoldin